ncbi:MAG: CoxG family protein [Haloferacaceae archaeon]
MRLESAGDFSVAASRETTEEYLTDAIEVCECLPGEIHEVDGRDDGGVTVHMTASHAGASEDVRVRFYVDDSTAGDGRVRYSGHGVGSRVKVDLEGEFDFEEGDDGVDVEWWGAADVGGVLSSLNRGVAGVAIRQKLDETADNVRTALDARAD